MKCIYCHAEIEQDAQFCTNCGKNLSKFNRCVNCGELLDRDTVFCPYCGTEQKKEEEVIESPKESIQESQQEDLANTLQPYEETKSKKGIWILLAILLLCVIAGAGYYFFDKSSGNDSYVAASDTIAVDDGSAEYDIHSVEGVKARLNEIFKQALNMPDDAIVNKYFSEDFRALYKKVDEVDSNSSGEKGFWEGNILDGSQEVITGFKIGNVYNLSNKTANADVSTIYDHEDFHSEYVQHYALVFENGNWFIDENNDCYYKEKMKEYVERVTKDEDSPTSFVGKVYKGSGNGGGLYTEMTISFIDDNQCTCVSDWYQAYSSPKTLKGQYEIKNNTVVVKCKDGDTEFLFEFEMKSNGRILEFDHSDPDMEGTIGNDYMSLEVQ